MNGLELAKRYYEEAGRDALAHAFPDLFLRMAVGLAGEGSECFGYDDEISRDHDWGAAFCIWLEEEDYQAFGAEVQAVYDSLPDAVGGYPRRKSSETAAGRDGVLCTADWYRKYTGCPRGPETLSQWRRVPEAFLATAVNGEVFHDPLGIFSAVRQKLLAFYPEDIRIKKIAARAATMAQAGQYNYSRCMQRGEYLAAELAKVEFIKAALSMLHLLNRAYAPYYKWIYRSARQLPKLARAAEKTECLARQNGREAAETIEAICILVGAELRRQGLTERQTDFLIDICSDLMQHIEDPYLRNSSFMQE